MRTNRSELHIDKHALDVEIATHPDKQQAAGWEAARLASERDLAQDEMKAARGRRYREIRLAAVKKGQRALSEAAIQARLDEDEECREAKRAYIQAAELASRAEDTKDAWKSRGFMIRDMVALYLGSYYAEVSVGGVEANALKEEQAEEARRRVREIRKPLRRRE